MRRTQIRVKVAVLLALPLVALVGFSAFEVRQVANEAAQVRSETQLASAVTGPAGVIARLQDERIWPSLELNGLEATTGVSVAGYDATRQATDQAVQAFRDDLEAKGGAIEATFRNAVDAFDGLGEIRSDIDSYAAPRSLDNMPFATQVYDRYSLLVEGLLEANSRITGQVRDAELRHGVELTVLATEQIELEANLGRQTATAAMLSPNGIDTPGEMTAVSAPLSTFDRRNQRLESASGRYAATVQDRYPRELAERLHATVETAITTGTMDDIETLIDVVDVPPEEGYPGLRDALAGEVADRADTLEARAATRQRLFVVLAVGATLLGATMTLLVSLSITRPLRSLTLQARDMAQQRLPGAVRHILETPAGQDVHLAPVQPLEVKTHDEVADVAAALNTVQESALDLAAEQAVLRRNIADSFVNLGRRNQNLLGRQLDFVTELESNETDPDILASLFQLDHLATRMRRNAESLLVLAGIDPPRKWAAPVRITDIIRAAVGEVEDYQRVRVDAVDPAMILGSAAADLAHLLAELVENALTFSPPLEKVVVHGLWRGQRGYRVTIVDQGLGMSPSDIAQANSRLAGSESMTVAPSRYLGHHVAGNLAARHGIEIKLDAGALRGIFATVDLPPSCLGEPPADADPADAADPDPSRPELRAPMPSLGDSLPSPTNLVPAVPSPAVPSPAVPSPAVPPRDQLLAALEIHTSAIQGRRSPSEQPPATAPIEARSPVGTGANGTSELPRRVRGAQIPTTQLGPLRASQEQSVRRGNGDDPADDRPAGQTRADQVSAFLSGFSAGAQRDEGEVRTAGGEGQA